MLLALETMSSRTIPLSCELNMLRADLVSELSEAGTALVEPTCTGMEKKYAYRN